MMIKVKAKPVGDWDGKRVLSVREPWATLIVSGQKDVENRSRRILFAGPLLIHASAGMTRAYYDAAVAWISCYVDRYYRAPVKIPPYKACKASRGKIVGGVTLYGCRRTSESSWFDGSGWAWELGEAWQASVPVPFKGQLSLATFRGAEDRRA